MDSINLIVGGQMLITLVVFIYTLIHFGLIIMQKYHVLVHQHQVPIEFSDHISLKEHQKSARYIAANANLNQSSLIFEVMLFFLFTLGGGIEILQSLINNYLAYSPNSYWSNILLVLAFIVLVQILQIPFAIYKTFFIEQSFGFNQQNAKDFCLDLVKSLILSIILIGVLLLGIFYLMQSFALWWLWAAIFMILFNLSISFIYPRFIAPLFNKFKPIENEQFAQAIDDLLQKCNFKNNGVFVMDGSKRSTHLNAYFTGFGKNKRIVLFDTLMEKLSIDELKSVLAHELGHFSYGHIHKRILFLSLQVFVAFYILFLIQDNALFYQILGVYQPSDGALIILISLILPVISFFFSPIGSYFSRKQEFEADFYAAKQTKASDLISALVKLYRHNSATLTPHPLYSKFFDSHPPAKQRIDHLKQI